MMGTLAAEAARRFPNSPTMQARWIAARERVEGMPRREFGTLIPFTMDALRWTEAQFTPRTLKQAGITP